MHLFARFHAALTLLICSCQIVSLFFFTLCDANGRDANYLEKTQFTQIKDVLKERGEFYFIFIKGWGSSHVPILYIMWLSAVCGS